MGNNQIQTMLQTSENKQREVVSESTSIAASTRFVQCADNGAYTITLPSASAVPLGTIIAVYVPADNCTGTITIAEATVGADTLNPTITGAAVAR